MVLLVPHLADEASLGSLLVQALATSDGGRVVGTFVLLEGREEGPGGTTTTRLGGGEGVRAGRGGGDGVGAISLGSVHVCGFNVVALVYCSISEGCVSDVDWVGLCVCR